MVASLMVWFGGFEEIAFCGFIFTKCCCIKEGVGGGGRRKS